MPDLDPRSPMAPGHLVVHAVTMVVDLVLPVIMRLTAEEAPRGVCLHYRPSNRLVDPTGTEEASVAIRASVERPEGPFEVIPLGRLHFGLYASTEYIARRGCCVTLEGLLDHVLVDRDLEPGMPEFACWLGSLAPRLNVVLRTNEESARRAAIRSGVCAGFLPNASAMWNPGLMPIIDPDPGWYATLWLLLPQPGRLEPGLEAMARLLGDVLRRCLV